MTNYNAPNDPLPVGPVRGGGEVFSAFSILAVIAVLLTFVVGPGLALLLAIGAIVFGALGMLVALSPTRRGGLLSFIAIGAGLLAIVIAVIRLLAGLASQA